MARPQKLRDSEILAVIESLRAAHLPSTGVDVRRELFQRFGIRAGTDRLYQLLRQTLTPHVAQMTASSSVDLTQLAFQRDAALRRAQLAEYRENAEQIRTAKQIDDLRQRLRELGVDPFAADLGRRSRSFPV